MILWRTFDLSSNQSAMILRTPFPGGPHFAILHTTRHGDAVFPRDATPEMEDPSGGTTGRVEPYGRLGWMGARAGYSCWGGVSAPTNICRPGPVSRSNRPAIFLTLRVGTLPPGRVLRRRPASFARDRLFGHRSRNGRTIRANDRDFQGFCGIVAARLRRYRRHRLRLRGCCGLNRGKGIGLAGAEKVITTW